MGATLSKPKCMHLHTCVILSEYIHSQCMVNQWNHCKSQSPLCMHPAGHALCAHVCVCHLETPRNECQQCRPSHTMLRTVCVTHSFWHSLNANSPDHDVEECYYNTQLTLQSNKPARKHVHTCLTIKGHKIYSNMNVYTHTHRHTHTHTHTHTHSPHTP